MVEAPFSKRIEHSICSAGIVESSSSSAYKIDDDDGLANHLGFTNCMLSKVDYFDNDEDDIQLIELSDLEECILSCSFNYQKSLTAEETRKGERLTTKEMRPIRKEAWAPIVNEFKRKWFGSIAVIERLYRKNKVLEEDPNYGLLIVCKNQTDVRMLDTLQVQLQGMMGKVEVCNTEHISQYLISNPSS